jgi:RNA polymerase sigma factor (sigma-70 family)
MSVTDHHALRLLYNEHNGWLKGWLCARTGNSSDAADLAQDTFVRLLLSRHADQVREPRTYLSTIARALMVDKFRRRAIEQAYLEALALRPESVEISPETRLAILQTLEVIDTMLDGLGERTRKIFLTVQLEGLSYIATSERFGVSVTTVKKHMIRAMTHCLLLTED